MAEGARQLGDEGYITAELVPTPTDLERAYEDRLEELEKDEVTSTRQVAGRALAAENWQPRVGPEMRTRVDAAYETLFSLSEEERALEREKIKTADPELFQAMLDAIEDENDRFKIEATLREERFREAEAAYRKEQQALFDAGVEVLGESRREIEGDPLYKKVMEDAIDVDGEELPIAVGQ